MAVRIGLGIDTFNFSSPSGFWDWLALCDNGGIDSIWQADFLISDEPVLECISTMAAIAARTEHLKFGMSVAAVGIRDPLVTAKACASIDFLSEGRLLPAFGLGAVRGYKNFHNAYPEKNLGQRANEALEIITRLWSENSVTFEGKFFTLKDATINPKPTQQPLPLWIGGESKQAIARTARWGTGWLAGFNTPTEVKAIATKITQQAKNLGRLIPEDHFSAGFGFRFANNNEAFVSDYLQNFSRTFGRPAADFNIIGNQQDILNQIKLYHASGVQKLILRPIAKDGTDVMQQTQLLIDRVLPEINEITFA